MGDLQPLMTGILISWGPIHSYGNTYVPWSKLVVLGMVGHLTFNRNPYNGYIYKPLRNWVRLIFPIGLLYGNVMGVDRPDRTYGMEYCYWDVFVGS